MSSNGLGHLVTRAGNLGTEPREQGTNANVVTYAESLVVRAVTVYFGLFWV